MFKKVKQKLVGFRNWVKAKIRWVLVALGIIGVALAAGQIPEPLTSFEYQTIVWEKPTTTQGWAEDVKKENLDIKFDYQLDQMENSLTEKIPMVQKDLDRIVQCPECIKWELKEQFTQMFEDSEVGLKEKLEGRTLQQWIDEEFDSQLAYYKWKTDKINQSLERIGKEKELRYEKLVIRNPEGTTYYIDCINGTNTSIGTATSTAGLDLDQFTEVARSAGDKVIVRRGGTACDNGSDLTFISNGVIDNPIFIEADYDNAWGDFASSSQTATFTFGSKTVTFAADISGELADGDWIYADGDNNKEFSYEVDSVATAVVTLYLPYKGNQSGAGIGVEIMPDNPVWNIVTGNYEWNFDNDWFWKTQGIDIRGTDNNGIVEMDSSIGQVFRDCIFSGNDGNDHGIKVNDDGPNVRVYKCRFYNYGYGIFQISNCGFRNLIVRDSLFDNGLGGIRLHTFEIVYAYDSEFSNHSFGDIVAVSSPPSEFYGRNLLLKSVTGVDRHQNYPFDEYLFEDFDGVIGDNRQLTGLSALEGHPSVQSETTTVRNEGGLTSIRVEPSVKLSTNWEFPRIKLFDYPIYANTTSKTYTVYFKTNATSSWTDDPTNSELWIEAEYWGHATNNHRKITKSTGVIDFNGTTTWQSLTVTAQPSQTGILYLRGWYAKTKETPDNIFYVDIAPTIQ